MRVTDTDCKGRAIIQNDRGTYMSLSDKEILEAIGMLQALYEYRKANKPRKRTDSRRNY